MFRNLASFGPILAVCGLCISCGSDEAQTADQPPAPVITPGTGIGPVTIGMRYQELSALYGEMTNALIDARVAVGGYPDQGLDVILSSPEDTTLSPDAIVIAVGAKTEAFGGFPRPGLSRAEIESSLGQAPMKAGNIEYYPSGVSVSYQTGTDGDLAKAVGVFPPFTHTPIPPEMQPAKTQGARQ